MMCCIDTCNILDLSIKVTFLAKRKENFRFFTKLCVAQHVDSTRFKMLYVHICRIFIDLFIDSNVYEDVICL